MTGQTTAEYRVAVLDALARIEGKIDDHFVRLGVLLDGEARLEQGQKALATGMGLLQGQMDQILDELQDDPEPPPPPPPPGRTLFGAFCGPSKYPNADPAETKADMRARVNAAMGPLAVERIFNEGSFTVPAGGTPAVVSFSLDPVKVAAGDYDSQLVWLVQELNPDTAYWLCLNHECDQAARTYTAAEQVAGFKRFATVVRSVGRANVYVTPILMSWTLGQGDPDHWKDWYAGPDYCDALGFDAYWRPSIPHTVEDIYGRALAVARTEGKPLLICETSIGAQGHGGYLDDKGTPVPEDVRTQFVTDAIAYLDNPDVAAVMWFETNKTDGDWLLEGHPEACALWAAAVAKSL